MDTKKLAVQIMEFMEDMDCLDYEEHYEEDMQELIKDLDKAKELGLVVLLNVVKKITD